MALVAESHTVTVIGGAPLSTARCRLVRLAVLAAAVLFLAGCGGGSDGTVTLPSGEVLQKTKFPSPPPQVFRQRGTHVVGKNLQIFGNSQTYVIVHTPGGIPLKLRSRPQPLDGVAIGPSGLATFEGTRVGSTVYVTSLKVKIVHE